MALLETQKIENPVVVFPSVPSTASVDECGMDQLRDAVSVDVYEIRGLAVKSRDGDFFEPPARGKQERPESDFGCQAASA